MNGLGERVAFAKQDFYRSSLLRRISSCVGSQNQQRQEHQQSAKYQVSFDTIHLASILSRDRTELKSWVTLEVLNFIEAEHCEQFVVSSHTILSRFYYLLGR